MYNTALNKVDEIVKMSLEFNDDLFDENIASIYSDILKCETNLVEFQNLLSEIWFLIGELATPEDREIVDEIETLIEEAKEILE